MLKNTAPCRESLNYNPSNRVEKEIQNYNSAEGKPDTETGYDCPKCKNKGYVAINDNGYMVTKPCDCLKIRSSLKALQRSGLGAVDKNTFANYTVVDKWQAEVLEKAKTFLNEPLGKWFFIGGQVGSGKTHICKAIAYEFIKRGICAKYMEWRNDVQKINAVINEPEAERIKCEFLTSPVLYIDDFLKTSQGTAPSQGEVNRAIDFIFGRYTQENSCVIISSEKTINEITAIDEAFGSRIFERAGEYVINIAPDAKKNYRIYHNS